MVERDVNWTLQPELLTVHVEKSPRTVNAFVNFKKDDAYTFLHGP